VTELGRHIVMSPTNEVDQTLNSRWLLEHSDRLLSYEFAVRCREKNSSEMFPEEIADKIGRPKEYVCAIIKNAISHAKLCKKPSCNTP
jgi:hypothetical protein